MAESTYCRSPRLSIRLAVLAIATYVMLVSSVTSAGATASGWRIQPIANSAAGLAGVSCTSASACTAVGGRTLAHWDGRTWSTAPNRRAPAYAGLSAISCASNAMCAAVGGYTDRNGCQVPLAERWSHGKWSIQSVPFVYCDCESQNAGLDGVSCTVGTACLAVGGIVAYSDSPLAYRWNGITWSTVAPEESGGDSALSAVSCTSSNTCTAVGELGLVERWNGRSWSIQSSDPNGGLEGVSCLSKKFCIAVGFLYRGGRAVTLVERWTGSKWVRQDSPNLRGRGDNNLDGISCTSRAECTAVGSADTGGRSLTLAERWDGNHWSIESTPNRRGDNYFGDISCVHLVCTAVGGSEGGEKGLVERWTGNRRSGSPKFTG